MSGSPAVGPFEVVDEIARGGMGVVFAARHHVGQSRVAIKILTDNFARRPRYQRLFEREIQAMAKLRHPCIATLLDAGRLDAATADQLGLAAHSPWLAMELVEGQSLAEGFRIASWRSVEVVLSSLLDALAHAHARGVLHRDLKPANVLATVDEDGRSRYKLVDFGIARASDDETDSLLHQGDCVTGTPNYMAPEQITGRTHQHGPWTDLYSLGCLTWKLLTRQAPFQAEDVSDTLRSHLQRPLPSFAACVPVPDGFYEWLSRLLEKKPSARFQRAADAAYALSQLGMEPQDDSRQRRLYPTPPAEPTAATVILTHPTVTIALPDMQTLPVTAVRDVSIPTEGPTGAGTMRPPLPSSWRRPGRVEQTPQPHAGAGLGIYGVRPPPVVGRDAHKDELWQLLHDAREHREPQAVLLVGGAGVGKTRLAEWLAWRAHEVGAVSVLRAAPNSRRGGRDELATMFARHFRLAGLDQTKVQQRLRRLFQHTAVSQAVAAHDALALAELIATEDAPHTEGFEAPRDKFAAMARLLEVSCIERPVLMWLDDIHWSDESVRLASFLIEHRRDLPITLVMNCRSEALEQSNDALASLRDLQNAGLVSRIDVDPLPDPDHRDLVEHLLGLEPAVAERVVARTAGNPLFAVQLVGDWVDRGILTPTERGFNLAPGAALHLPDDIHELWRERIHGVLSRFEAGERAQIRASLELGAALGRQVSTDEWLAAAAQAGIDVDADCVSVLFKQGLANRTERGWTFAHTMLRESLERSARSAGRWRGYHLACTRALAERVEQRERPAQDELHRIAEHAGEGGDARACLDFAYEAAQLALISGDFEALETILELRRRALDDDAAGRDRARQWWLAGNLHRNFDRSEQADECAEQAISAARASGWEEELAHSLQLKSQLLRDRGHYDEGIACCTEAKDLFAATDDQLGTGHSLRILAFMHRDRAELEKALDHQARAYQIYHRFDAHSARDRVLSEMGYTALALNRSDDARSYLRQALEGAREWGNRYAEASAWNNLGEVARFEGDWESAREFYAKALEIWFQRGDRGKYIAQFNLAIVELATDRHEDAATRLHELLDTLPRVGLEIMLGAVHLGLATHAAHHGVWAAFDAHLTRTRRQLADTRLIHKEVAWLAERAGLAALAAENPAHARQALSLARDQWQGLEDRQAVERIDERLAELSTADT